MLRLRFEVDYASRSDGRPDAPGDDVAASLAEKQEQLAEAQAAVQVRAQAVGTALECRGYCSAQHLLLQVARVACSASMGGLWGEQLCSGRCQAHVVCISISPAHGLLQAPVLWASHQ